MLQKFQTHINQHFPFFFGKKLLIAISGGLDSVALTHLCSSLKNLDISLAHCNFKLRGNDSNLDEEFVKDLGKKLQLKTFTIQFETSKLAEESKTSTQIIARELRYNWFEKISQELHFDYILTAHHLDDSLETFIINFTRGSGLKGLTGIPSQNGNIFRPLLIFTREEIKNFAIENKLDWREDVSNAETKYVRNKIRHEIVPKLKEINPNLLESFANTSEFLQESEQIIADRIKNIGADIVSEENGIKKLKIKKLLKLSNPKIYLYQLLKPYGFTEWNDVTDLLSAQSGKQIFSKTHRLLKDRKSLLLSEILPQNTTEKFYIKENETEITTPILLKLSHVTKKSNANMQLIFADKDLLKFPLIVRKWEKGDYFCPSGMRGKKKLSKYFKDEKLSLLEKENIWLLCNANNDIIWVIGKRQDNRFVGNSSTENYISISINLTKT